MKAEVPSPQTTLVILLGASEWPSAPDFRDSEAFANSAGDFKKYFLDPNAFNLPKKNLLDLFNSNLSSDDVDRELGQFLDKRIAELKESNANARDVIIYFVGHGGFAGSDLDYYLAIRRTRMENPIASSIRIISLAHTLKEKARYLRRIIILDCCFAASASIFFQSSEPEQAAMAQTIDAFKVHEKGIGLPGRGTSLLCSSRHNTTSLISPDGRYTMFSEALLYALNYGNPSQHGYLTLRTAARLIEDFLQNTPGGRAPRPEIHSPDQSEGDVADVPFFPNLSTDFVEDPRNQDIWLRVEESEAIVHQTPRDQSNDNSHPRGISRRRAILGILTLIAGSTLMWEIVRSHNTSVQNIKLNGYTTSTIYTGHSNAVWCVAWSHDGLSIASGGADHTLQVWYSANGRNIHTYNGHQPYGVRSVAWSPNNIRIASGGDDKTVQVWDATTGDDVYTYRGHNKKYGLVYSIAWAPNSLRIASGNYDSTVQVWNATDGSHPFIYHGHFDGVHSVAWSPDSTLIVSGGRDLIVRVWNASNGSSVSTYNGHKDVVTTVAWSPNGAYIASAGLDKTVEVWEAMTGTPVISYGGHAGTVTAVAWAKDSMHIASASIDKTVQVWNAITGNHILTYRDHTNKVWGVTWSSDGNHIASAGEDKTVRVWQIE
jgi:WD40 repeat protein